MHAKAKALRMDSHHLLYPPALSDEPALRQEIANGLQSRGFVQLRLQPTQKEGEIYGMERDASGTLRGLSMRADLAGGWDEMQKHLLGTEAEEVVGLSAGEAGSLTVLSRESPLHAELMSAKGHAQS